MQSNLRSELERLLEEGTKIGEVEKSPEAWEVHGRQMIDNYLGPKLDPPTNAHSQEYYDFIFANSHSAKLAILRAILRLEPKKTNTINKEKDQRKDEEEKKDKVTTRVLDKTQIIVAIIGAIGVIAAAVVAAWFSK
jgi:hypothetical protein